MEEWVTIDKHPNYKISNHGRVKNKSGLIMKQQTTPDGYLRIELKQPRRKWLVHRLVIEHFSPYQGGIEGRVTVDHIDSNKKNNKIDNLCWVSNMENVIRGQGRSVIQKTKSGEVVEVHRCMSEAARKVGGHVALIGKVASGERNTHAGYIWEYA